MLEAQYDNMAPEQKTQVDAKVEHFLSVEFPDEVVIHVEYGSNNRDWDAVLARFYQNLGFYRQLDPTVDRNFATLVVGKSQRIQPVRVEVLPGSRREFELRFPRRIDGKPVIEPGTKSIAVEIAYPDLGTVVETAGRHDRSIPWIMIRELVPFKVKDMVQNGRVTY
jgi:hypothetical protein